MICSPRRLLAALALVVLAALGFSAFASAAAPHKPNPRRVAAAKLAVTLNGSFESNLSGWDGWNATLSTVTGGRVGLKSARVSSNGSKSGYAISPSVPQISSSLAGSTYNAATWVRSARTGKTICQRLREWSGSSVVASARKCITASADWLAIPSVQLKAVGSGHKVDYYVFQGSAVSAGDSFEVDGIWFDATAPLLPAPSGLAAGSVSTTGLRLSWTAVAGADFYHVSQGATVLGTPATTSLAVDGLACGQSYTFSVRTASAGAFSTAATTTASTAACPAPAPAPAPDPAPAPAPVGQLYSSDSPFNKRVPASPELDPASGAMVAQLAADAARIGGWPVAAGEWTQAIYYADASTPRYDVSLTHTPYAGRKLSGVPIPAGARPSPDGDSTLVVIDRTSGCEYDFQRAQKNADGTWTAHFGNTLLTSGTGVYPYSESPRAAGFGNAAGVIRPEELAAGRIDHALAFVMHNTKAGGPVAPATGSDGWSTLAGAIPEGGRVQLDPSLDLDSLGLTPWQKTIARALQEYGMLLVDTGGGFGLQAQWTGSTSASYPWGAANYAYMPDSLIQKLRVLKSGPQFPTVYRWVDTPCASLK